MKSAIRSGDDPIHQLAESTGRPLEASGSFRLAVPFAKRLRQYVLALLTGPCLSCSASQLDQPEQDFSSRKGTLSEHSASHPTGFKPKRTPPGSLVTWRYHPRAAQPLTAQMHLSRQRTLSVSERGERWLSPLPAGEFSQAASMLAPEKLVGLHLKESSSWVFVGQSGTSYWSNSPLGAFSRTSPAPHSMLRTVVSGPHILAIGPGQHLWKSPDAGLTWKFVGPPQLHFSDLWIAGPQALALQTPEALWSSHNAGAQFFRLGTKAFGATALATDTGGRPVAVSVLGLRRLLESNAAVRKPNPPALAPPIQLPSEPAWGPSAQALRQGRAVFHAERYTELLLQPTPLLLRGDWKRPLQPRPLPIARGCLSVQLAAFERWIYIACTRKPGRKLSPVEFFQSRDEGESFSRIGPIMQASMAQLRLTAGSAGQLVATGICPQQEAKPGCYPSGIHILTPTGPKETKKPAHWQPLYAPALQGAALAIEFADNGQHLLALGRRTKNEWLYSFSARNPQGQLMPHRLEVLYTSSLRVESMSIEAKGTHRLVLSGVVGQTLVLHLNRDGLPLATNQAPIARASVGTWGSYALAHAGRDLWQSFNSGTDWSPVAAPRAIVCERHQSACHLPIACSSAGCVIGESVSRHGWSHWGTAEPVPTIAFDTAQAVKGTPLDLPTIVCDAGANPWQILPGVHRLPGATHAALGQSSLYAMAYDYERSTCGAWLFPKKQGEKVKYESLMPAVASPENFALAPSLQVEGIAALRYPVHASSREGTPRSIQAELAWLDLQSDTYKRHVIPLPGTFLPSDYDRSRTGSHRARPALLSIASGGIFVRPHATGRTSQSTLFIDNQGSASTLPFVPWPAGLRRRGRAEMARLAGHPLHLLFVNKGATVVRATQSDRGWSFDAMTTGNPLQTAQTPPQWDISYTPTGVALARATQFADGSSSSLVFPFQLTGSVLGHPLSTPTQRNLPKLPKPCTAEQIHDTSRVIAAPVPGSQRTVEIRQAFEATQVFRTKAAVLFGSPDHPCLSAYEANRTSRSSRHQERAIVTRNGSSWLLRTPLTGRRKNGLVEYLRLDCTWPTPANYVEKANRIKAPTPLQ